MGAACARARAINTRCCSPPDSSPMRRAASSVTHVRSMAASAITLWMAVASDDGLVVDDYYKRGLGVNQTLSRDHAALEHGYRAALAWSADSGRMRVTLRGAAELPPALRLRIVEGILRNEIALHQLLLALNQLVLLRQQGFEPLGVGVVGARLKREVGWVDQHQQLAFFNRLSGVGEYFGDAPGDLRRELRVDHGFQRAQCFFHDFKRGGLDLGDSNRRWHDCGFFLRRFFATGGEADDGAQAD